MPRIAIMGVAEIAPSTAESALNYFSTGWTACNTLNLTLNLIFHVGMVQKNVYLGHPKPILDCFGGHG